ncbi:cytochrome c [Luteolibacter algae]|uniref:Cytochrome c n=1 Tax=Luteolibacter algae TaxID=454151 RepID=A0ABW5D742_9BACT
MMKRFLSLTLLFLCSALSHAGEKSITLPMETAKLKPGKGADLTTAYCMICHSVEYITTQPKMPRKFWEAEVLKMKEKFGAPVPEASVRELVDYLTQAYGSK